jgi:signal transduction histidine kinase/ligand-binding sensor domain-containing protein
MTRTLTRSISIFLVACLVRWTIPAAAASNFAADSAETASSMRTWHAADGPDGLPSDSVTAVLQTHDGFLWVGTTAGVVRFDGVKFTGLPVEASSRNNVTGVTALCEDSRGFLWIGTQQNGLFELAGGRVFHFSRDEGLLSDNVSSLATDNHGRVWVGSHSGLNLWTGQKFVSFTKNDGLPDESVSGVNVARSGTVWITTRVGMCRFIGDRIVPYDFQTESQGRSPEYLGAYEDQRGNLWAFGDTYLINLTEGQRFNYFRSPEPGSLRIWSLCEGRDGRLWIGTSGRGLFCFQDNRFQPVILHEDRGPYDVRAICEDHEGNLWLGTSGGGLVQLRLQSVFVLREGQGLPDGVPTALGQDTDGRVYVGLERGGVWKGEPGRFDPVGGTEDSQFQNFVSSVCVARDGTVWAGTHGDGIYGVRNGMEIHLTTADGLADNLVSDVCVDNDGAVWASAGSGILHRITNTGITRLDDPKNGAGLKLTAMAPATHGGLWLGTRTGRVLREAAGKLKIGEPAGSVSNQPVLALCEGARERLWIGTAGGGLFCLTSSNRLSWNTNNGLPSAFITGIVEDSAQNLWLATPVGIFRAGHTDLRRALNDPASALYCKLVSTAKIEVRSTMIGGTRMLLAPDGYLWFVTSDGVLNIDTRRSEAETPPFPVYIESAAINGEAPISLLEGRLWSLSETNKPFKAPVDLRSLEIHYTALSFISPEEIQFRHKLEGSDRDWVPDGRARSFRYTQLRRGAYNFRVSARMGDGPWLESGSAFSFTVPTPFYFQTWAICLYVIFAITLVTVMVRIISHRRLRRRLARLEQEQTLERERMRIARDMHDEMGSKLTKISFLSEHMQMDAESAGQASDKIQSIAQTSRDLLKTMDEIVWVVNPHNDTLENLVTYFSHHAVEYFQNTSIDCEIRLPQEVPHLPLSSEARHNLFLAFEETLNNVLKHSNATNVNVAMKINAREFELVVADNGCGFEVAKTASGDGPARGGPGGNGLRNIRQRLSAVGGECAIGSRPGSGTTVTMIVRLNEKRSK